MGKYWAIRLLAVLLRFGAVIAFLVILFVAAAFASAGALPVALLYFCASLISPVGLWALAQFLELMIRIENHTRISAAAAVRASKQQPRPRATLPANWGDPDEF